MLAELAKWLQEHPIDAVVALILALVFAVLCAWAVEVCKRWGLLENKKIPRLPSDVCAESLVGGLHFRRASGAELMRAINRGALELISRVKGSAKSSKPSHLETAWADTSFAEYSEDCASFVRPACRVAASGATPATTKEDALGVLMDWLLRPPKSLHGEIRGDTGTGKTTLLHRTFVEMMESVPDIIPVVPMLASADNIYQNADQLERLKHEGNHLSAFVLVWLEKRRILAKSEKAQKRIAEAIEKALREGRIVLFVDGVDELRAKGAGQFVDALLDGVKHSIVTRRYEDSALQKPTRYVLTLESAWDRERIFKYVNQRLSRRSEAAARIILVLTKLIPEKDTSSSWLSLPSNLRAYMDEVARPGGVASEAEMCRLAESATGLMEELFDRDIRNVQNADPEKVREALSNLALCKPGTAARRHDSPIGKIVAGMKTLLRKDGESLVFRHAAEAEYFLARRLGEELLAGPLNWADAKALRTLLPQPWGTGRIRLIDEVLRDKGGAFERADKVKTWLMEGSPVVVGASQTLMLNGKRNLVEIWKKTRTENPSEQTTRFMQKMNLDEMDGRGLDLREERVESTSFRRADLRDAEMMHARFICRHFDAADLRSANATGADFEQCKFGDGDQFAKVSELEIEGIQINPSSLESKMIAAGAWPYRSRYRGKFGEQFLKAQKAFLGSGLDYLETSSYVPSIEQALRLASENDPNRPVYLIDLMAGGQGGRSEQLLSTVPQLHILSIDRDRLQHRPSERHRWLVCELGAPNTIDRSAADPFGLSSLLLNEFPESCGRADVVIAKKALHELDRQLQPLLLKSCGLALQSGGHLVLFVDTPGPDNGAFVKTAHDSSILKHEELRKLLLKRTTLPPDVKSFVTKRQYPSNPSGEWLFVNDWIAIKDWANLNLHELSNRYFASIAEIREWAKPYFKSAPVIKINHYDINPLRFNERGVNNILHFLERYKCDREAAIAEHRTMLMECVSGSEKFRTLVDITREVFASSPEFASMMKVQYHPVQLATIDPLLASLEIAETAPQFEMKCAVISFEGAKPVGE